MKHKAEIIEGEYIRRLLEEALDMVKQADVDIQIAIPRQVADVMMQVVAIQIVATKIAVSAKWN